MFQPLLYQCATGILSEGQITAPLRRVLRGHRNVRCVTAQAIDIDPAGRALRCLLPGAERISIPYDHLIVAAGVGQSYFGVRPVRARDEDHLRRAHHQAARLRGVRELTGEGQVNPFRYIDLGSAAYIARGNAVVSAGRLQLSGFPGWVVWLFIHIAFLTGYRNRVGALLTWWVAFTRDVRRERAYTTREVGRVRDIYQPVEEAGTPAALPK